MRKFLLALVGVLFVSGAHAQALAPSPFEKWLSPDSPKCIPVDQIGKVANIKWLTKDQFQFIRALYIAIPPISRTLPPGDRAMTANIGTFFMAMIVAKIDNKEVACARFVMPNFIVEMLAEVGKGDGKPGEDL